MARLPLEDTFGDILAKAMRGTAIGMDALAQASGVPEAHIVAWTRDAGHATQDEAHALAHVLRLDPAKLAESAAEGWYPPETTHPNVHRHSQHPHPSNGYIFTLDDDKRAVLVDPAGDPAHLLRKIQNGGYDLQYILITHKHADHCDAAPEVAASYPNATIVMNATDAPAIGSLAERAISSMPAEPLSFGDKTIRTLLTPGHTDGSVCYIIDDVVFTGDTLFAASVGGAYGTKTTYADVLNSVATQLFTLPPSTLIMPGHGPATTMAQVQAHNAFFAAT